MQYSDMDGYGIASWFHNLIALEIQAIQCWNPFFFVENWVLSGPAVFDHFLDPPGNHPCGAIFPTLDHS